MRRSSLYIAVVAAALVAILGACATTVTRVPVEEQIDLSGRWNDVDSQKVARDLVQQSLDTAWVENHLEANGAKPAIIVGDFRNKTAEHIPVKTLVADLERTFINSGRVTVVASPEEREGVRAEREDQQRYAAEETVKQWGREHGADYMLLGEINAISDREGKDEVKYYQVDSYLVDLETNVKVWSGSTKIKKFVGRSSYRP